MVKHTQTHELFECVWPFCGTGVSIVNNKDTTTVEITWTMCECLYCLLWADFAHCFCVFTSDFQQVKTGLDFAKTKRLKPRNWYWNTTL